MGKHSQAHSVPLSFLSSLTFPFFLCFLQNTLFQVRAHTLLIGAPTLAKALVGYGTCTPFPPTSHSFLPAKLFLAALHHRLSFSCAGSYPVCQAGLDHSILLALII